MSNRLLSMLLMAGCFQFALIDNVRSAESLIVGTGSPVGVYHQVGKIVCRFLNDAVGPGPKCQSVNTGGSLDNLDKLRLKTLDAAVVQSDWQYHAYKGSSKFALSGAVTGLRSLFSLYVEPLTIIARARGNIARLDNLPGHIVNIGNQGSGHRATMEQVMIVKGWNRRTFKTKDLPATKQADALCSGKVDAIVFMVGHPNKSVRDATDHCQVKFVSVEGPDIDKLVSANPFYAKTEITAGIYRDQVSSVPTFGVVATMVATNKMSINAAYRLVKIVFEHLRGIRQSGAAFQTLDRKRMVVDGLSAPLHPGAAKYFKEVGLIK